MSPVAGTVAAGTVPAGWWDVTLGPMDAGAVWLPGSTSASSGTPGALQRRAVATVHPVTGTLPTTWPITIPEGGFPPWTWDDPLPATSATRTADGSDPVLGTDNLSFTLEDAAAVPAVGTLVGLRWTASDGTVLRESVHRVLANRTADLPNGVPGPYTVNAEHWLAEGLRTLRVLSVPEGGLAGAMLDTGYVDGVGILMQLCTNLAGFVGLDGFDVGATRAYNAALRAAHNVVDQLGPWSDPLPPAATYGEVAAYITSGAYSVCEIVMDAWLPVIRPRHTPHQNAGLVLSTESAVGGLHALPAENLQVQATAPAVDNQQHRRILAPNPVAPSGAGGAGEAAPGPPAEMYDGAWAENRFLPRVDRLATLEIPWGVVDPPERAIYVYGVYEIIIDIEVTVIDTRTATPWCAVQVLEACGAAERLTLTLDGAYPVPVMGEWVRVCVPARGLNGWYAVRGWTQPSGVAAGSWTLDWRQDGD